MKLNVVPPRAGLAWVKLGIRTFWRQPLALTGLFFMFWTSFLLISLVPFVGLAAALVLTPTGTLGLLVATSQADEGRFPWPGALLQGLRSGAWNRRQLLVLGGINAALVIAIILSVTALASQEPIGPAPAEAGQLFVLTPAAVIASALQLPLTLLFTLAPALVFWHGVPAGKALFFAVVALWRNLGAFVVFALAWIGVLTAVLFFLGVLLRLVAGGVGVAVVMPLALVLLAMVSTSLLFPFRDSFTGAVPSPTPDGDPS